MSTEPLKPEIFRFLANSDPEVICITGKWGVGKTFAWTKYLAEANAKKSIKLKRYSYVSLFGRQSIDDIRSAIFENTVSLNGPTTTPTIESVTALFEGKGRKFTRFLKTAPTIKDYVSLSERILYATMKEQIIVVDDLERLNQGLSPSDILGLVSELKEQKHCKVVILLNAEKIDTNNKPAFESQLEKVADATLSFCPTPEQAADIGLSPNTPMRDQLIAQIKALSIVNIRVIKKIERSTIRLAEILKNKDSRVISQAITSVALFTWAKLQPDDAPSINFLKRFNQFGGMGPDASEEYARWRNVLSDYGYGATDEFDLLILEGVERGFFDPDTINIKALKICEKLKNYDSEEAINHAWKSYHDSFDNNTKEVVDLIDSSCRENIDVLTPLNANGAIKLIKELGFVNQGKELAYYYISNKVADDDFWDLSRYPFRENIDDPDLIAGFNAKHIANNAASKDPVTVLIRIHDQHGWNRDDIEQLSSISEEEFYNIFKTLRGTDLLKACTEALRFQHRGEPGSSEHDIFVTADSALERIASESTLNARRVNQRRAEALR